MCFSRSQDPLWSHAEEGMEKRTSHHDLGGEEARVFDSDVDPLGVSLTKPTYAELRSEELDGHNAVIVLGRRGGHGHVGY